MMSAKNVDPISDERHERPQRTYTTFWQAPVLDFGSALYQFQLRLYNKEAKLEISIYWDAGVRVSPAP